MSLLGRIFENMPPTHPDYEFISNQAKYEVYNLICILYGMNKVMGDFPTLFNVL